MIIIMLGAPASGKGSVAEILSKEFEIPAISSGDIFRKYISEGTEIGKRANEYMTKGELVPDDLTVELITERLNEDDVKEGLILDGFPRTVNQAKVLDEMLSKEGKKIDIVVNLETPEEEILERITNRRICKNSDCKAIYNTVLHPSKVEGICDKCGSKLVEREDDKIENVKVRLREYRNRTKPLIDFYRKKKLLVNIDASQPADVIFEEISKILEELQ